MTEGLAGAMRSLIQDPDVSEAFRFKVESALAETFDKPCLRDFHAMTDALRAPAREVDAAAAEVSRLTSVRDKQSKSLAALTAEYSDNAARRDAAQILLPEKQAARSSLESGFTAASGALDNALQTHDGFSAIDVLARKKVHTSKENIAAMNQRETRIDARLQALRQASSACSAGQASRQECVSENQNENANDNKENIDEAVLLEIKSLVDELNTLTARREIEKTELAALEQELAKSTNDLQISKSALDAARAERDHAARDLASMKKRIAELEADIMSRNQLEQKLGEQIEQTKETIATLDIRIQDQKRIAQAISPPALARYKAFLKPFDDWDCARGMALIEGTFCVDLYEYPNARGKTPVTDISWTQAESTCRSLGKRLCTDAEWTFTCNGPQCYRRPVPQDYSDRTCNLGLGRFGDVALQSAGRRPGDEPPGPYVESGAQPAPNPAAPFACDSPYGPADMVGNAWEWVADTHKQDNAHGVRIGGHTSQFEPNCGDGSWYDDASTLPHLSFRCCADPGPALR